jgi:TM2 domain-containing membrane protein YozV
MEKSQKNFPLTLLLAFFFGIPGGHRLYVGKVKTALLMPLTVGGLGLWYLSDLIRILLRKFKDKQGKTIKP